MSALALGSIKQNNELFKCFNLLLFKKIYFVQIYSIRNNAVKIQQAIVDYITQFGRETFPNHTIHIKL